MIEGTVARCAVCGTSYTARGWYWLEPLDRAGDRRTCAMPGCGSPVERARDVALRLAAEALSPANDPVIDEPMRSESEMKQPHNTAKKKPGRKPPPPPAATDDTPAMISIRGHSPADYAAFERARARISAKAGGAFISLSQAVLVLARTQAEREDAEERARAAALAGDPRDELIRNLVAARRKVEESTSDDWTGTVDDRMRLVQAEDDALAALARTVVVV